MTQLHEAIVLITGAAGGFGREFTRQLLQAGSHLILTDLNKASIESQVAQIQKEITTGKVIACLEIDLSNREGCYQLYEKVKALEVPIDILINNAGIGLFGRMDEIPAYEWEKLMEVNLMTPMCLSTLFVADMIARQKGHIVNISSIAGWIPSPGMAHYSTSKFGLRGFSEALLKEVKDYNVKVTAVYPFFSRTPILDSKRYGSLAENSQPIPQNLISNPADIIEKTIQAIIFDGEFVFPDRIGNLLHLLKRYFPSLLDWILARK